MTQKTLTFLCCLTLAIAIAPGCGKDNEGAGADIQPGIGLKDVKIGDEAQVAINKFGPTTTTYVESNGQFIHYMNYQATGIVILLNLTSSSMFDKNTTIRSFSLDAPFSGTTDKNIGIGSTKADVKAAYGQPDTDTGATETYTATGIAFTYDAADKVENILVSKF